MTVRRVGITRTYRTIAEAYFLARAGDILLIDEGVYIEQVVMDSNKHVHLIGNTHRPDLGKVVISPPNESTNRCVEFLNLTANITIYMEGIHFKFPIVGTLEPISATDCDNVNLVFNKCILNATDSHEYVFDSNLDNLASITLNNCRVIWKDDYIYTSTGAYHFERSGKNVAYKITKCIFSNEIKNINSALFSPEQSWGQNELTTDNTSITTDGAGVVDDLSYTFDDYAELTKSTWTGLATGDTVSFTTDFGEGNEKTIIYFRTSSSSYWVVRSAHLYASTNNVDWIPLYKRVQNLQLFSVELDNQVSYRYYRLDIVHDNGTYPLWMNDYTLACLDPEHVPFDYTLKFNLSGYGPYYGDYQKYILDNYYLEGSVSDSLSEAVVHDTVVLDVYNGSSKIELSGNDLSTTLRTTYANQHKAIKATVGKRTGKWYYEFKSYEFHIITKCRVGFGISEALNDYPCGGGDSRSWGMELYTGNFYYGNELITQGPEALYSHIVGVALDLDNGKAWFSVDGEWVLGGDPVNQLNPIFTFSDVRLFPMISLNNIGALDANVDIIFDPTELNYTIPEGFVYYSEPIKWKINCYRTSTNEYLGHVYTDDENKYHIETSYSGSHFLICEDTDSNPAYNDLIYSNLIPKEYV